MLCDVIDVLYNFAYIVIDIIKCGYAENGLIKPTCSPFDIKNGH